LIAPVTPEALAAAELESAKLISAACLMKAANAVPAPWAVAEVTGELHHTKAPAAYLYVAHTRYVCDCPASVKNKHSQMYYKSLCVVCI
jgi:hypothetical protein